MRREAMSDQKNINIKSIVLSITLAIIAIVITITIISLGIGIDIFKADAQVEHKALEVAALQLNKLHTKSLNLVGNDLNTHADLVALDLKGKSLLAPSLDKQDQLLVSELANAKSLLPNGLNSDQRLLNLVSLNSQLTLQPSLNKLV
jgi:hypothetical protein